MKKNKSILIIGIIIIIIIIISIIISIIIIIVSIIILIIEWIFFLYSGESEYRSSSRFWEDFNYESDQRYAIMI